MMVFFSLLTINPHDLRNSSRPRYTVVPGGRRWNGGDIGAWGGILPIYIQTYTGIVYIQKSIFDPWKTLREKSV